MGLKLRLHLFYKVDPAEVYEALSECYEDHGWPLQVIQQSQSRDAPHELWLHERDGDWTVLDSHGGWEWEMRRKAQLHVSRVLHTTGVLVWVVDGDYWVYELFADGVVLDDFTQDAWDDELWIPETGSHGDPALLARQFPWIRLEDAAAYLVRTPTRVDEQGEKDVDWAEYQRLDVPPRPGDEFTRFDECAALDFLRLLGIRVALRDRYVRLLSPIWRTFRIAGDPWLSE
jgi:hypothetical protein